MRRWTSLTRLSLLGVFALAAASCGGSTQSQTDRSERSAAGSIEDSGKRLSGDFAATSLEDSYAARKAQPSLVFTFDENGNFKKQDKSRMEEGSYLISMQGELVIYVEKVNGEMLPAARVDRYSMSDQRDDGFTLLTRSGKLGFRKR